MIFAELDYAATYSEIHDELKDYLLTHFSQVDSGLQGDSWFWIILDGQKVAIDTFSAMKHQVKAETPGPQVQRVIEVLQQNYAVTVYPTPQPEGHEEPYAVHTAPTAEFVYTPPASLHGARQIVVKPNLGYPVGPPVTVSMAVLGRVLAGLRHHSPQAEILIVEGVCSKVSFEAIMAKHGVHALLDEGMRLLDADQLDWVEYPNRSPQPVRFKTLWAPKLLQTVDGCLSVSAFKRTQLKGESLISASLKNLYGLMPRAKYKARSPHSRGQLHRPSVPLVLQDVYFTLGSFFHGGVVDCTEKFVSRDWQPDRGDSLPIGQVIWGDDLLAVDKTACLMANESTPSYVTALEHLRSPRSIP